MKHVIWIFALFAGACTTAAPSSVPIPAVSPVPVPTAMPETTPTSRPILFDTPRFTFQGVDPSVPIVTRNPSPVITNSYINPGAVLFHDGQFHMFFNSFSQWPGVIEVGYMTSADGYHWQIAHADSVFTTDHVLFGGGHADVSSVIVMDDGTWVMYFHTIREGEIGRATATSPLGPWTVDEQPVLVPGPSGSFDSIGLYWPSVVRNGDEYFMYYGTYGKGHAIGLATSTDGFHWTKYNDPATEEKQFAEADPVLQADGDWDAAKIDRPRVQITPDGWVMIFQGGAIEKRGLAISNDGLHWKKYAANPIFTADVFPIPNAKTWDTNLVYHAGGYYYFMELGTLSGTDVYLATHQGSLRK